MNKIFEMSMIELLAAGLLIFLLSIWFGKVWNNRKLRGQKAKLDADIEALKANHKGKLQSLENELQVERQSNPLAYAHLIEKRVAVLDQGYKYLVDFDDAIRPVQNSDEIAVQQQSYDSALLRFTSFVSFFERNKVYFSRGVAKKVSKSHAAIAVSLDLMSALLYANQTSSNGINDALQNLFNKANSEITRARVDIESELRAILRVEDTNQHLDTDNDIPALSIFS